MDNRRIIKVSSSALAGLLAIFLGIAMMTVPALAAQSASATRDIQTQTLAPGESTTVTVTITNSVSQALSLDEDIPAGWTLTRGTDDAATFKPETNEWVWFSVAAGVTKTVTYTLTVPSDATEGYYQISGNISNATGVIDMVKGDEIIAVALDATPPTIEFIAPTPVNGSTVTVNYVNVTVNVTDESGVSSVVLNWNGVNETMYMIADNTWSVNKTGLSNGDYTFKVYANDTYDNWGASEARTVNVMTAAAPTVSINPASQDVSAGDTFTVNIAVDPAGYGVSSGSITISFDATVMQADSVVAGDLLGTSPIVPPGFPKIDNTNGTVQIDLARSGTTIPPTPEGTWAVITFTVNSDALDGTHTIGITAAELADETFADIPGIKTNNGTVTIVTGYPRWDINNDGTVNYIDLAILGAHYGENTETPYPRYDINEDGTVNYIDLAILGAHYGENYI